MLHRVISVKLVGFSAVDGEEVGARGVRSHWFEEFWVRSAGCGAGLLMLRW